MARMFLSLFFMISYFSSSLYGMNGARGLVVSCVKHLKSKVVVPVNGDNMIELHKEKEPLSWDNTIRKFDPYWGYPHLGTKKLQESIASILYIKQKNGLQKAILAHYENDAFDDHNLSLKKSIYFLNNEIGDLNYAKFVVVFPACGPDLLFDKSDGLRCRKYSNELQELVKSTLLSANIKLVELPYAITCIGTSPIKVEAVLSTDDYFPSRWRVDTACDPVRGTGFRTEQGDFVDNNAKE